MNIKIKLLHFLVCYHKLSVLWKVFRLNSNNIGIVYWTNVVSLFQKGPYHCSLLINLSHSSHFLNFDLIMVWKHFLSHLNVYCCELKIIVGSVFNPSRPKLCSGLWAEFCLRKGSSNHKILISQLSLFVYMFFIKNIQKYFPEYFFFGFYYKKRWQRYIRLPSTVRIT